MEKIRFDIVGLAHNDVRDSWKEYAAGAVGKLLTMQPQSENVKDPYAIRAREGSLHVGYVAVTDLDVVYQALKGSGLQRLRGRVVESNPEPPVLTVECEVDCVDWDYEPFDDSVYAGWRYDGLSLVPKELESLSDLTIDIKDALKSNGDTESICRMTKQLLDVHLYDVSREMTRDRYRIERLLAQHSDPELQEAASQMRLQKGMLMKHDSRDEVASHLFLDYPERLWQKELENYHYTYYNRLDELEQQLRAFPYHLYDKFLNDPVDFLREVYYKHVPRQHLLKFLSGIILMILKGRVEIKRWGRDGDTEPIERIRKFSNPADAPDRENMTEEAEALHELLQMKDKEGHLIIKQKNQWAGIMSVLVYEYQVIDEPDMRAFCHKMDEWGFGKDGGYENYCDYDNLSKASKYALHPFKLWTKERGAAYQRQVRAATELRGILKRKI